VFFHKGPRVHGASCFFSIELSAAEEHELHSNVNSNRMAATASVALSSSLSCGGAVAASTGPGGFPLILTLAPFDGGAAAGGDDGGDGDGDEAAAAAAAALGGTSPGAWVAANQAELEALLAAFGAILFRGFVRARGSADPALAPTPAALGFSELVRGFSGARWQDLPYADSLSYAVRSEVCARVCTTNEGRLGGMVWHHEQAQAPRFPRCVFFFCEVPADAGCGGATGITPSTAVHEALAARHAAFLAGCAAKGLIYKARLPPSDAAGAGSGVGRSWRSFWRCETREQAEARMRALGYSWSWEGVAGDVLRMVTPALPAVVTASGRKTFFNQAIAQALSNALWFAAVESRAEGGASSEPAPAAAPASAPEAAPEAAVARLGEFLTFGDGSPVDLEALRFAAKVADERAYDVQWERGDVALIDNYQVMHARRAWLGDGPRRVLASLVDEPDAPLPVSGHCVA